MSHSHSHSHSPIEVIVRTRPTLTPAKEIAARSDKTIAVHMGRQGKGVEGGVNNQPTEWRFQFDELLAEATQETVYEVAAKDIVESVMQGYNGTIMAYGQTGAGKTHTIVGDKLSYDNRGIIPRAIGHIFRAINDRPDLAFRVSVSYTEIYNEHVFDLLAVRPPAGTRNPSVPHNIDLPIQEDVATGAITVKGLNKKEITNEQECLDALFRGDAARAIGEHALNEHSTRSHCIYTIYLECRSRVESSEKVLVSKLNLIDLAGSERVKNTGSSGVLLAEANFINKSLTFLEQVVIALSTKHREHIPFRQSRLTQLLKDSLGGNTKTRVICNIHVDRPNLDETISTLKFGTRMKKVTNRIAVNIALDPLLHVAKLQKEVRELKHELEMHDTIANRLGVTYDAYTPEESALLKARLEKFVSGGPQAEEIEIVNLRQVREAFRQFKAIILEVQSRSGSNSLAQTNKSSTVSLPDRSSPDIADDSFMVGDVDEASSGGFGVGEVAAGRAPSDRPDSRDEPLKPKNILRSRARAAGQNIAQAVTGIPNPAAGPPPVTHIRGGSASRRAGLVTAASTATSLPPVTAAIPRAQPSPKGNGRRGSFGPSNGGSHPQEEKVNFGRQLSGGSPYRLPVAPTNESAAFEDFRSGAGFDLSELLSAARADAAAIKRNMRDASIRVNEAKKRIDDLTAIVADQRSARMSRGESAADIEVLDEDEYAAMQQAAAAKAEYRQLYQHRGDVEQSLRDAEDRSQQARVELFTAFADWYRDQWGAEPSTNIEYQPPPQQQRTSVPSAGRVGVSDSSSFLDPNSEVRSFLQATRNVKSRPIINGGRRPYVGAAFK